MSSISNPAQLVDAFKKSGEFDRLRKELLADFQRSDDDFASFKSKIADIARQRLASDQSLHFMPHESVHRELMQEVDRFPIVERAAAEAPMLSDPSFIAGVTTSVRNMLYQAEGIKPSNENTHTSSTSTDRLIPPPTSQDNLATAMSSETSAASNAASFTEAGLEGITFATTSLVKTDSSSVHSSTNITPPDTLSGLPSDKVPTEASSRDKDGYSSQTSS